MLISLRHAALGLAIALPGTTALAQNYSFSLLGSDGGLYWVAADINNRNRVVGTIGQRHWPEAVIWNAGRPSQEPSGLPFHSECCTYRASFGAAINDRGQVVGEDTYRAALWNPGARPVLLAGESSQYQALDLNEAGTVVGYQDFSEANVSRTRAVVWDAAGLHELPSLGGLGSAAYAINESGTIVGRSSLATPSPWHATLWQDGTAIDLGVGNAYSLNDLGQVVGEHQSRATLWNGTQATFLDDTEGSFAADINNRGWVVGSVVDDAAAETRRAMLWRDGQAIDLNSFLGQAERDAGWYLGTAVAINDHGWIVGTAFNDDRYYGAAYVLSIPAIPEPASMAMLLAGLGVIGVAARRRSQRERRRSPGRSTA